MPIDKISAKFLVILFAIIQIIVMCVFLNYVQNKNTMIKDLSIVKNKTANVTKLNVSFTDKNILRNPTWEQMGKIVFFKRSSAFYVIERSLLRIFFISKSVEINLELDFRIEIIVNDNEKNYIYLKNATIKRHGGFGYYVWNSLNYNFDLLKYLNLNSYDDILANDYKFNLYILNSNNPAEKTLYPIDVNLRYIRSRPNQIKKGSIVCSKCFWMKKEYFQDLFWWI